jgi:hypothetical protein
MGRLSDLPGQAGGREGLVFGVREEGLTVSSIRRFKGGRFLAIVLPGFCTWEVGLIGIQKSNHHFARFEQALSDGKHIFFVDLEPHFVVVRLLPITPTVPRCSRRRP